MKKQFYQSPCTGATRLVLTQHIMGVSSNADLQKGGNGFGSGARAPKV